jgi:hypothetical protein
MAKPKTTLPNPVIDPALLTTKRVAQDTPLTTIQRIALTPNPTMPTGAVIQEVNKQRMYSFTSDAASKGGGISPPAKLMYVSDEFQPAVGVYILCAPNASGKTILSCGIVAWANGARTPASYVSCFEPRSHLGRKADYPYWKDARQFINDARATITKGDKVKLIVYDSATLPMKAYASNFANQATFAGGSQPSDRGFLDELSKLAAEVNACIIIVLNQSLIPYVSDLEGAVEGIITIVDVSSFTYRDRTTSSGRQNVTIQIPLDYVNAALQANYYGPYKGTRTGVAGLRQYAGMYSKSSK